MSDAAPSLPVLYYDGACPVCSREIAHYRHQPGSEGIVWVDAAHCPPEALGPDLNRTEALRRLHLRQSDGQLVFGAAAFVGLWQALPAWSWLGRLFRSRPAIRVLDWAYLIFLKIRPLWRREAKRPSCASV